MKYIVTGGLGFVGSNLVDLLVKENHQVYVVDDLSSGKWENRNPKASYHVGKVSNVMILEKFKNVEAIFHCAAQARIQPSFADPKHTIDNNISETAFVAEFARLHNIKVIYAGSSTAEDDVLLNPYAFSKFTGEEILRLYSRNYNTWTAIPRFFNVYGPRNPKIGEFTPVIAIWEEQYKNNQPLTITGDGENRRDFTHVFDVVQSMYEISKLKYCSSDIFHLGTGFNFTINEVASMFKTETKYIPGRKGETRRTKADNSYLEEETGFKPSIMIKDYIEQFLHEQKTGETKNLLKPLL